MSYYPPPPPIQPQQEIVQYIDAPQAKTAEQLMMEQLEKMEKAQETIDNCKILGYTGARNNEKTFHVNKNAVYWRRVSVGRYSCAKCYEEELYKRRTSTNRAECFHK